MPLAAPTSIKPKASIFRFADTVLSSLVISVLSLAMPLALLQVYDRILPNESLGTWYVLVAGVGLALLLEVTLRYGRSYLLAALGAQYEYESGVAAFQHLLGSRIESFESIGPGVLVERFNALRIVRDFYSGQAIVSLFDLPFAAIYFILIWYIGGSLVLVPITLLLIFIAITALQGVALSSAVQRQIVAGEDQQSFLVGLLSDMHSVKAMALEGSVKRQYDWLQEKRALAGEAVDRRTGFMLSQGSAFAQLSTVGVVSWGVLEVLDGELTHGGLAACTMLASRALQPLSNAIGFWTRFQGIRAARRQFESLFQLEGVNEGADNALEEHTLSGRISLRGVSASFPGSDEPLLRNVELEIPEGSAISITGPNGSGKSVLLSIIAGIAKPTSGHVLVDGIEMEKLNPSCVRRQIVLLPQKESVFRGTILENITMFRPELEPRALAAARLMGINDQIDPLPLGFRTVVGEGTTTGLPRGLAQCINIARALVNRPKVLIFDEANSALDDAGDRLLKGVLRRLKGHCTLILVSHRPSILTISDHLYHLENGELAADSIATEEIL
jgi:ATP-binding cassette subfamily C protein LapB